MEWISVKKSLPDYNKPIVVYFADKDMVDTSEFLSSKTFLGESLYGKVTHWMPLPVSPKEV